ncbi:hypothetical protein F4808DRAFT_154445 [Astrocystis sublimbata]|nr:hypothetical protein F4808DRAFT_154445 [Astrocystis sublimbata]
MRALPKRLLPVFGRWGSLLFAVLVVYYLIRAPISLAVSSSPSKAGAGAANNRPNAPGAPAGPAAAQDARNQNPQAPLGDNANYVKHYKPNAERYPPLDDHFPWLTKSGNPPPVPEHHLPPSPHVDEATPILIGFTRNWPLLLQCVSSYIAAGWPPSDIYVVENTGTFGANQRHELTLQNPFFLNHTALHQLGVNVIITPTLLNFAQLQNFYLHTALMRQWRNFFWAHQDSIVFSDEDVKKKDRDHDWDHDPFATLYERSIGLMRYLNGPEMPPWATHYFAYDLFTLINRDAYLDVGAWDTHIPFYAADCDMYLRLHWAGYWQPQSEAGLVYDVGLPLKDIGALFRIPGSHAAFAGDPVFRPSEQKRPHREAELKREQDMYSWVEREGESFQHLVEVAERMQATKWAGEGIRRNTWQGRQMGGQGEPYYRDIDGFASGVEAMTDAGRRVFADKWGHRGCDLLELGIQGTDAWRLERDWDITQSPGHEGGNWGKDWSKIPSKALANLGIA